jgi:hypothetical protein
VGIDELLRRRLIELGARGGKARATNLTPKQRTAAAKKAAAARWGKKTK